MKSWYVRNPESTSRHTDKSGRSLREIGQFHKVLVLNIDMIHDQDIISGAPLSGNSYDRVQRNEDFLSIHLIKTLFPIHSTFQVYFNSIFHSEGVNSEYFCPQNNGEPLALGIPTK